MTDEYISNRALYDLIESRHKEMIQALKKHEDNEMDEVQELKKDVKGLMEWKNKAIGIVAILTLLAPFLGIVLNNQLAGG